MSYELTVSAVVFNPDGSKVALIRRQEHQVWPNTWSLPGGRVEINESLEEAVIREVGEEIGELLYPIVFIDKYTANNFFMFTYLMISNSDIFLGVEEANWVSFDDLGKLELAPNTLEACKSAKSKHEVLIEGEAISNISRNQKLSTDYLLTKVASINNNVGWPHYLGLKKIGIIGTAVGILSLIHGNIHMTNLLNDSVNTLISYQSDYGGWSTTTAVKTGTNSVTESTVLCTLALSKILDLSNSNVKRGIEWLFSAQQKDGGWGSSNSSNSISRVYPTSLCIESLSEMNINNELIEKAKSWLISAQNPDGGWSTYSNSDPVRKGKSDASHTAYAITSLIKNNVPVNDEVIQRGVQFLLRTWDSRSSEGGWTSTSEIATLYNENQETGRVEIKLFSSPQCLISLLRAGIPISNKKIIHSIYCLIELQNRQGFWTNILTPGEAPIWATYDMIRLISEISMPEYRSVISVILSDMYQRGQDQLGSFIATSWEHLFPAKQKKNDQTKLIIGLLTGLVIVLATFLVIELFTGAISLLFEMSLVKQIALWFITIILLPIVSRFISSRIEDNLIK